VSRKWVVNASPLILLGKVGRLQFLEALSEVLVIPQAVADEINAGDENDAAHQWISGDGFKYIQVVESSDPIIAGWDLGVGESSILTYARQHTEFEVIIDDRAARNCAKALKIPVRGTLGIILLAKREQMIPTAKPIVDELIKVGLRIDQGTIQTVLKLAGE
jgi:predicted nucleic acid-binding protein